MIPFEKQVCSLELAKRLKELGVKQESYFTWFAYEGDKRVRLLLDSRGVAVPMASNSTWVMLSSLKPYFWIALKRRYASWTTREHKTLESNKSAWC